MEPMNLQSRVGCKVVGALLVWMACAPVWAVPAFARQTGQSCVACHVSFPELTPYGRWFKLSGYTIGLRQTLPLAMMAQAGVTQTSQNDDGSGGVVTARDKQWALNGASLFLAGKVTDDIGGFVQWTYSRSYNTDGTSSGHSGADNIDLRWVGRMYGEDAAQVKLLYGLTLHNNPTVQDVWNTTPAFGYPYTGSPTALRPTAATQIEQALAAQVAGFGGYAFWDHRWYAELTLYRTADGPFNVLRAGYDPSGAARLQGLNPYLRLAFNHEWGDNSLMVVFFGMKVNERSDPTDGASPVWNYRDLGVDAQFQHITQEHTFTAQASYIHEHADYGLAPPGSNTVNTLHSFKLKGSYFYDRRWGVSAQYFRVTGSADAGLYAPAAISGSANGLPDSSGHILELSYAPLQNLHLILQYTAYDRFNGGNWGYDGVTARRASDNNSLFLNAWISY